MRREEGEENKKEREGHAQGKKPSSCQTDRHKRSNENKI